MRLPKIQSQFIALSGGMDLTTPPIVKAGSDAIQAVNVQPSIGGGFSRIEGYQSIDGEMTPSKMQAVYLKLNKEIRELLLSHFMLNNTQCYILDKQENHLVVATHGRLKANEGDTFQIGTEQFTLVDPPYIPSEITAVENQELQAKAFAKGIELVKAVPGQGYLLGVVELGKQLITFRSQGDECGVFYATSQGWQKAPSTYQSELEELTQPDKLAQGTQVHSGNLEHEILSLVVTPDGNQATIVTTTPLQANAEVKIGQDKIAKVKSSRLISLNKDKPWQFIYHNFYGSVESQYAYGCNGDMVVEVRKNGVIVPITLPQEKPKCITAHANHLFVAFEGGQFGHSLVGNPTHWSILLGSEQFGVGDEITVLSSVVGGVLLIGCQHKVVALYGTTREDWVLKNISKVGIKPNTLQSVFVPIAVSEHGIIRVDQTEQFGDFRFSELSASRKLGFNELDIPVIFSSTHPQQNQIRFYTQKGYHLCVMLRPDGTAISTYFRYPKRIEGVWQTPNHTFMAFDDGMVYQQSSDCNAFAKDPINWNIKMAFNHFASPTLIKSWHSAELQATAKGELHFQYRFDLDYNADIHATTLTKDIVATGDGGRWNDSDWNDFLWSSADYSTPTFPLYGYSRNISVSFSGVSTSAPQFELTGLIFNYITRRNFRV